MSIPAACVKGALQTTFETGKRARGFMTVSREPLNSVQEGVAGTGFFVTGSCWDAVPALRLNVLLHLRNYLPIGPMLLDPPGSSDSTAGAAGVAELNLPRLFLFKAEEMETPGFQADREGWSISSPLPW